MTMRADTPTLDLPPGFRAVPLREYRDAFTHAQAIAAEEGAGTLVWVRRFDTIEAAVVLEPEQALGEARCALYAGMNALADALATHCPPEKPLEFVWPDTILLDGGIVGGCRIAAAAHAGLHEVPDWLVLGLQVRSVVHVILDHRFVKGTSLASEGFEMLAGAKVIESFARHLMATFDGWRSGGFRIVAERYVARLQAIKSMRQAIDADNGDLLQRELSAVRDIVRTPLAPRLFAPQWLDPATGEPWI